MTAYYNEHDANAAAWLRELVARELIAPGEVDERSVADVEPTDLRGFTQCHFFAGIGVWSYALRSAGWSDATPVWTGSCPCQPFSASGKRGGTDDQRHLWPAWFRLIRECRPHVCFGEQVASKDGLAWFDFVCDDLERAGYAVGACDTCAAGVGAPHIRQRLYFVADAVRGGAGHGTRESVGAEAAPNGNDGRVSRERLRAGVEGATCIVADAQSGNGRLPVHEGRPQQTRVESERRGEAGELVDAAVTRLEGAAGPSIQGRSRRPSANGSLGDSHGPRESTEGLQRSGELGRVAEDAGTGATAGFWSDAEWIACRDGKARPVRPGTFPLVTGAPARVVRLRGYGNSLVAPQAQAFIEAYLDVA